MGCLPGTKTDMDNNPIKINDGSSDAPKDPRTGWEELWGKRGYDQELPNVTSTSQSPVRGGKEKATEGCAPRTQSKGDNSF